MTPEGTFVGPGLVSLLACPRCDASLEATADGVRCPAGHAFGRHDGYLDMSGESQYGPLTTRTAESFGFEWNTFDDVRTEDEQFAQTYFRDVDLGSLAERVVLDAGCGKGRYTRFLAGHAGALVALDGSDAVVAAARNLASYPNVLVLKADLRHAPLRPASVDFVSCLGVLHHLEDPEEGFRRLRRLLAPGGTMLIYVYSSAGGAGIRRVGLAVADVLRRVTVRLPLRALRVLSVPIAASLYVGIVQLGRLGDRWRIGPLSRLPMSAYRGKSFRSLELDTFDRFSAPIEHRYAWPELSRWFARAGLDVVSVREDAGWFVVASDRGAPPVAPVPPSA